LIENIGFREGSEVPRAYIEYNGVKKLKAFKRIFLDPKESSKTFFKIPISDLDLWDSLENKFSVPRGQYIIHLGTSSADLLFSKNFIVK
jgi:beta-glucosidase